VRGLARLLDADWGRDPVLGPGTVNIGAIEGGVAANILAPAAAATILVRLVRSPEEALERIRAAFADPETGGPDARIELEEVKRMKPPRLEPVEGYPTTIVAYGTDAPFLEDAGRLVLFGPGSIRDAHTAEEKISKESMLEAVGAYADLARRLAAE
jgi:acetylornithine deacetylase